MRTAAAVALWTSVFLVIYAQVLYPVVLFLVYSICQLRRDLTYLVQRKERRARWNTLPGVSLVIPAHNEAECVRQTLEALGALDYPAERLQIIFVCDGCTDGTYQIVQSSAGPSIECHELALRSGKASALDFGVQNARNDILVFCDASTILSPDSIRMLVRHFADSKIGVVCGALGFVRSSESQQTEGLYWRYESMLRLMEGRLGATLTASGALYSIRRECYRPLPADAVLDDFLIPMRARALGYGVVYDPEAKATEFAAQAIAGEAQRRVRIARGSLRALPELVRTPMSGITWFVFVSHKLLRWTIPALFLLIFVANCMLATGKFYQALLALQVTFYLLALAGRLLRVQLQKIPGALLPYFVVAMVLAFLQGFFECLQSRRSGVWEKVASTRGVA